MKDKQRLLTIEEYAAEMGVSKHTVFYWRKKGLLTGLFRYYKGPWLIPEENLDIPRGSRGRPKLNPPSNQKEAKERYDLVAGPHHRVIPFSYDDLMEMFLGGMTYQEIAILAGVTTQRVQQVYRDYFAPFLVRKDGRRKAKGKGNG